MPKVYSDNVRKLLSLFQVLLLAAGIALGVLWYRHPHEDFDALLGISVAILAALEYIKRKVIDDPEMRQLANSIEQQTALLNTIQQKQNQMQAAAGAGSPTSQTAEAPTTKPVALAKDPIEQAVTIRSEIERRLIQYGKLKKISNLDNVNALDNMRALQLLDQLDMPLTFKNGLRDFFTHTADLVHEPIPMIEWAAETGKTLIGFLDMVIKNAGRS